MTGLPLIRGVAGPPFVGCDAYLLERLAALEERVFDLEVQAAQARCKPRRRASPRHSEGIH
jgi:hypothetical protein